MFEGSVLYISLRSPFARRVRIALREAGVRYEERVVDLFGDVARDAPDLLVANPLGRVPVWVPAKGLGLDAISESAEILALFFEVSQNQKDRGVQDVFKERLKDHRKSGLAVGLCEAVVARYLERMKSSPSPEVLSELEENIERTLQSLGVEVFDIPTPNSTLTQGQIDLICALDYLRLRMGENEEVQALFKRAEVLEFVREMHERPAVKKPFPPNKKSKKDRNEKMCGRFGLTVESLEGIELFFGVENRGPSEDALLKTWKPRFNIAPSQWVPVVRMDPQTQKCEVVSMKWGLVPAWAEKKSQTFSTINARVESVEEKPMYKNAFARGRCLVPFSHFFEWKELVSGDSKTKQPYCFTPPSGLAFFAAISEQNPSGLKSVSLLTQEASSWMGKYHHRMPIIWAPFKKEGNDPVPKINEWLNPMNSNPIRLKEWLIQNQMNQPCEVSAVSKAVNSPKNDTKEILISVLEAEGKANSGPDSVDEEADPQLSMLK